MTSKNDEPVRETTPPDHRDAMIAGLQEIIAAHHKWHAASAGLLRAQTRLAFILGLTAMYLASVAWSFWHG